MDASSRRQSAFAQLDRRFGAAFSVAQAVRARHAQDVSAHPPVLPDAVVTPGSIEEVQDLVRIAAGAGLPLVAYGSGTSCEGHIHAVRGGLVCDLSQMNRILAVRPEDLDCTVEPGVTRLQLNRALKGEGLHFPIDPGADATLGGMLATGASGTNAVRYRTMKENVLGLTLVMADGTLMRSGTRARKSSAGYNLTELFVGSEGTLGIVVEAHLRLYGLPEAASVSLAGFDSERAAVSAAVDALRYGLSVAPIELMDGTAMAAVAASGLAVAAEPTLLLELDGTPAAVAEQTGLLAEIVAEHGGRLAGYATEAEARAALWQARSQVYFALLARRPGSVGWPTDVCVPLSALAEAVAAARRDIDAAGLEGAVLGHVGGGNFHVVFVLDPDDEEERRRAEAVNDAIIERAIAAGGTCTGEHGIGYGKIGHLEAQHGDCLPAMRALKAALDPQGIQNPGKIFRQEAAEAPGSTPPRRFAN